MSESQTKSVYDVFKVQIPTHIIRDNTLDSSSFVVYAKLIHIYYGKTEKNGTILFDHSQLKQTVGIKSNQKLKKIFHDLYDRHLIKTNIEQFPRIGFTSIELDTCFDCRKADKAKEDKHMFAQLPYYILTESVINKIGHIGVRLIYYYQSYINNAAVNKDFCYTSFETIVKETGISENTIIKYNEILKSTKMIKVIKHKLIPTNKWTVDEETGLECMEYERFNNHYYVQWEHIQKYFYKLMEKKNKNGM